MKKLPYLSIYLSLRWFPTWFAIGLALLNWGGKSTGMEIQNFHIFMKILKNWEVVGIAFLSLETTLLKLMSKNWGKKKSNNRNFVKKRRTKKIVKMIMKMMTKLVKMISSTFQTQTLQKKKKKNQIKSMQKKKLNCKEWKKKKEHERGFVISLL